MNGCVLLQGAHAYRCLALALVDQAVAALELAGGVPEPQAGAAGTANGRRTRAGSAGYGLMQLEAIYSRWGRFHPNRRRYRLGRSSSSCALEALERVGARVSEYSTRSAG